MGYAGSCGFRYSPIFLGRNFMQQLLGYVRVSTREQNLDRQLAAMKRMGIKPKNIYMDKLSGKDFSRPQYQKLMGRIDSETILCIHSIDRLGRNYQEVLEQWRQITKVKGADIVVLDMPLLDTRKGRDLLGTFVSDVVLQVLSFVAENERRNLRQRQAEGIAEARKRGVRFGRPCKPLPSGFSQAYQAWKQGRLSLNQAARQIHMPVSTFYNKCQQRKKRER